MLDVGHDGTRRRERPSGSRLCDHESVEQSERLGWLLAALEGRRTANGKEMGGEDGDERVSQNDAVVGSLGCVC